MTTRRDFLAGLGFSALSAAGAAAKRPNILLIVADDLGFSDLGCYGGEISTPNLDRLAKRGVRFTQFYNSARCCPSRASLMTGLYPHQAGMGNMVSPKPNTEFPGYAGHLREDCPTIPEVLRKAGYTTLMAGKWHLGQPGPVARGFEEFYGIVGGFDSFWDASKYTRLPPERKQPQYPEGGFYATNAFTDHALEFLGGARKRKQPYFLFLSYTAPHFPLHAPKDLIDKYVPVYEKGWDAIREARFRRLREAGLIDPRWEFTPRSIVGPNRVSNINGWAPKQNPAWDSIDKDRRADLARRMAVYAAMIEAMDRNIGRVLADLEKNRELDNTLILFFSDNGACAEWDPWGFDIKSGPDNILHKGEALARMGQPGTYHSYGSGWANASNTPWRLYKHYTHEGGITTPFIVHWPAVVRRPGGIEKQVSHLIDLMPTFAELAGISPPKVEGVSLVPVFQGKSISRGPLFWEHEGSRAMREGKWKLTAVAANGPWELYDMEADRTEMRNLADQYPDRVRSMVAQWESWARRAQVIPWIWSPQYQPSTSP